MWVYALKTLPDGKIDRYKARLVVRGSYLKEKVQFSDKWAPTGRSAILRCLFAMAAKFGWEIWSFDISGAYLNAKLKTAVYVGQPPGFDDGSDQVWCLNRALYGLPQSGHEWWCTFATKIQSIEFMPTTADPAVYIRWRNRQPTIIFTHVDDGACFGPPGLGQQATRDVLKLFPGRDQGKLESVLGMAVSTDPHTGDIAICQEKLILDTINALCMPLQPRVKAPMPAGLTLSTDTSQPPLTKEQRAIFQSIVGSLQYFATMTRPDLSYTAAALARGMATPTGEYFAAAVHAISYLAATSHLALTFNATASSENQTDMKLKDQGELKCKVYSDADWATCLDTRRSITGYVITIQGTAVMWASRKQTIVAKSTMVAEYIAASAATDDGLVIHKLLADLKLPRRTLPLFCDNMASTKVLVNPIENAKMKYVDIHYHSVRERIEAGAFSVVWVPSHDQLADCLTKSLPGPELVSQRSRLGVV
jgi:hypothetical protein